MSFTFIVTAMLLSSSVVVAFILQPSKQEFAASTNSPALHHSCQGESLQSIRKGLLRDLNLRVEPQLPAGGLDQVREQFRSTLNNMALRGFKVAPPVVPDFSVSPAGGNSTSWKCCSMASEIFMKDLGWDSWVVHPTSLTIVQCGLCNPDANPVQCPSSHTNIQDADSQGRMPCCQPTSKHMVPIMYVDEFNTIVISSVQLTRDCSCSHDNPQQPNNK